MDTDFRTRTYGAKPGNSILMQMIEDINQGIPTRNKLLEELGFGYIPFRNVSAE